VVSGNDLCHGTWTECNVVDCPFTTYVIVVSTPSPVRSNSRVCCGLAGGLLGCVGGAVVVGAIVVGADVVTGALVGADFVAGALGGAGRVGLACDAWLCRGLRGVARGALCVGALCVGALTVGAAACVRAALVLGRVVSAAGEPSAEPCPAVRPAEHAGSAASANTSGTTARFPMETAIAELLISERNIPLLDLSVPAGDRSPFVIG
jgi:hypothetical protein